MSPVWRVRLLMLLVAGLILLRPGFGEAGQVEAAPGADLEILLVVDRTTSMSALDFAGVRSRMEGVREDLDEIVAALPDSRFALITFGRTAQLEVPFTSDAGPVFEAIDGLAREPLLAGTGSRVDRPLDLMTDVLRRAGQSHPDRRQVVVFASDGEITVPTPPQRSFSRVAAYVDDGAVFGYGTSTGGLMPTGGAPPWTFVRDPATKQDARSRIDEPNLRAIADQLKVTYAHRAAPGGLDDWAADLRRGAGVPDREGEAKYQLYWMLAILLFGLGLTELRLDWLGLLEARKALA
jgi:Ca-activated chloride channel family protein